ncbi:MAG: serine hydrolase domain-containing protein [Acidobacteriota bacterium]|nr:serine hydrolase domain-containing protein [Acidobacteriota bacterium]
MKKAISLIMSLVLVLFPLQGRDNPVEPSIVGLSAERLARIAPLVQSYIDDGKIAGAVTLVSRRGKIVHFEAHGMADIEADREMATDDMFRMFSMTKQITSVAVLMLFEEGRFNLVDPISLYIPEFAGPQVLEPCTGETGCPEEGYRLIPAKREITIQHLLSHTSGISYTFNDRDYLTELYMEAGVTDGVQHVHGTTGEMIRRLAAMPLYGHPGETYEYSLSTDVLGYLVEVISGKNLGDFCRERIFEPLGMDDTCFWVPPEKLPRMTAAYSEGTDGIFRMPDGESTAGYLIYSPDFQYNGPQTYYCGGGGLVSTAEDYARFLHMLLGNGRMRGKVYLGRKTVELMRADHTQNVTKGSVYWPGHGFGLGPAVHLNPGKSGHLSSAGEWRWSGLFYTWYQVDPEEEMVSILLCQLWPTAIDLHDRFHTLVYSSITDEVDLRGAFKK